MTWTAPILAALTLLASRPPEAAPGPPPREFRAAWVATVANIDWPSRPGLDPEAQRAEAVGILDLAARTGLNAVVLQVRASGDAFYDSPFEPWSAYLSGRQGQAPEPRYDPLAFWCEEAHRRGLLLHAWFNPFRARAAGAKPEESPDHVARARPDLVRAYGDLLWLDPGEPDSRAITSKVILDVVRRYDVDGIHFDDYFYPYPIPDPARPGQELDFPDEASWAKARASGVALSRADWRRDNINRLIEGLSRSIKAEKPMVLFGISPFGIPRPGLPPVAKGFDQYEKLSADALLWLDRGWADYFSPQLYWKVDAPGQPFQPLLDYWVQSNTRKRHLWPGLSISRVREGPRGYDPSEILRQVALTRETPGATGNILFSFKSLPSNRLGIADKLRDGPYRHPALIPTSPWLAAKPPGRPVATLSVDPATGGSIVEVRAAEGPPPFLWAVQEGRGPGWTFATHPGARGRLAFPPEVGMATISAVDRLGNLGDPVEVARPGPR